MQFQDLVDGLVASDGNRETDAQWELVVHVIDQIGSVLSEVCFVIYSETRSSGVSPLSVVKHFQFVCILVGRRRHCCHFRGILPRCATYLSVAVGTELIARGTLIV